MRDRNYNLTGVTFQTDATPANSKREWALTLADILEEGAAMIGASAVDHNDEPTIDVVIRARWNGTKVTLK